MGLFYGPTYILVIIGVVLSMMASSKVKSTYSKFSRVLSRSGVTAESAAGSILNGAGIYDVRIDRIQGNLTDHYDPKDKVLRLSDSTYGSSSVAAIGVAAHECGHAIQDNVGYTPIRVRSAIVPVVNIGSKVSWPLIIIGLLMSSAGLLQLGIIMFALVVVFQLVTLPVEFDASRRAIAILGSSGTLYEDELQGAKKVLDAAALTYVAAAAASILQLLRLILLFGGRRRD